MAAFKARKSRQRRPAEPVGRGRPIIPNHAIEAGYRRAIMEVAFQMIAEYKEALGNCMETEESKKFFAMDASVSSVYLKTLNSLRQRWRGIFEGFALKIAPKFVGDVESAATDATLNSLSVAGLKQPRATYNEYVRNTIKSSVDYNHTLITNISEDVHEKIYSAVMLSLTSPNPMEQGTAGITEALRKVKHFSKDRIKLIARDQTSKIYSAISDDRMRENGVEEFEWLHSSAGKVPRPSHVAKDGQRFKLNDPRLWEGPKADQGPPGWAINCRCRKIPIIT